MHLSHRCEIIFSVLGVVQLISYIDASEESPITVVIQSNVGQTRIGDKVVILEQIPKNMKTTVVGVSHEVFRVGSYSKKHSRLVNLDIKEFSPTWPSVVFPELPGSLISPHGVRFNDNSEMKGIKFEVTPRRVGVFFVVATFYQKDGPELSSNPIIIMVNPPKDAIDFNREWLEDMPRPVQILSPTQKRLGGTP